MCSNIKKERYDLAIGDRSADQLQKSDSPCTVGGTDVGEIVPGSPTRR